MKGILFKPSMIKAIMEGRKTMTRRTGGIGLIDPMATEIVQSDQWGKGNFVARFPYKDCDPVRYEVTNILKPKYKVGETIYVKEPWAIEHFTAEMDPVDVDTDVIIYKMDHPDYQLVSGTKWHNPMFMPASAARTFLKITNVRVEKLGDITAEDIVKEGIGQSFEDYMDKIHPSINYYHWEGSQKDKWEALWRTINKSYDPDQWLFVYEFEVVPKPENLEK